MRDVDYLMESEEESIRLEAKTDPAVVEQQALWAQIRPGMRVADLGCGCGKTTSVLYGLVQPGGTAVGVDLSEKRLEYAHNNYARPPHRQHGCRLHLPRGNTRPHRGCNRRLHVHCVVIRGEERMPDRRDVHKITFG